jgi:hypothetical protein
MILFQKRFHAGILDGSVTLTFRAWPAARVKPGGRYRCHPIGVLEVDSVDRVRPLAITNAEARSAGFEDRAALLAYLVEVAPDVTRREVFRVRFHYGGDGDRVSIALDTSIDEEARAALLRKLEAMDRRSADGPWTGKTLALIAKHPRIAASKLAAKLGREKLAFKADVVKLKKLGLTQSFEVGYELSPRGAALLAKRTRAKCPGA